MNTTEYEFFDLSTAEGREKSFAAGVYPYVVMFAEVLEKSIEEGKQFKHNWSKEGF